MAKQRDERFQTAHDLGEAIADYLFRHRLRVTSFDIARLMQSVVASKDGEKRRKMDSSIIDQLISDELLAFTSIDDMSDPLSAAPNKPASPDRPKPVGAGAKPLDAGSFGRGEDPTAWYSDEDGPDEATSFFDRNTLEAGETKRSDPHELAALLESDETGKNKVPPPNLGKLLEGAEKASSKGDEALSDLAQTRKPPAPTLGGAAVQDSGSRAGVYAAIALGVLVVLGAAAWFGGLIPH